MFLSALLGSILQKELFTLNYRKVAGYVESEEGCRHCVHLEW